MKKLIILIAGIILIAPALCCAEEKATDACVDDVCTIGASAPGAASESAEPAGTESIPEKPAATSTVEHSASAIERATTATSITCGISPAAGIVALPCLAVDSVNFASKAVGWIARQIKRNQNTD